MGTKLLHEERRLENELDGHPEEIEIAEMEEFLIQKKQAIP